MNSWLILLLLLFGSQNSRDNDGDFGCGRGSNGPQTRNRPGERDWNDERGWNGERNWDGNGDGDCGCDNDNNRGTNRNFDSDGDFNRGGNRNFDPNGDFESRYDTGSSDNSGCGCNN